MANNTPDYLQGFHDGKIKANLSINEAISYLNERIQYLTIIDSNGEPTGNIIINIGEFKKLIEILRK